MASGVWGYWMIDFEEPACLTRWGDFKDMGCDPREDSSMTRVRANCLSIIFLLNDVLSTLEIRSRVRKHAGRR